MFTQEETDGLAEGMDWLIADWASRDKGWEGPRRREYMDEETEKKSQ